jgi:hypothetical protein
MSNSSPEKIPEYRGANSLLTAWGGFAAGNFVGALVGSVAGAVIGNGAVGKISGSAVGAVVVGLPTGIYLAVKSYQNAEKGKADYYRLAHENGMLREKVSWTERGQNEKQPGEDKSYTTQRN